MKINKRKPPLKSKEPCSKCGENYLQNIYVFTTVDTKKKLIKIGIGCPECLKGELNK